MKKLLALSLATFSMVAALGACAVDDTGSDSVDSLGTDDAELSVETADVGVAALNSVQLGTDSRQIRGTATYVQNQQLVTVQLTAGFGKTYNLPTGAIVNIHLTATNDTVDCLRFDHWIGTCTGTNPQCAFAVDGDKSTRAVWVSTIHQGCVPK